MSIDKELLKGTIPVMVLRLISSGDRYGYEIIKLLGELSGGGLAFKEGTLYPILHALERQRFVRSYWQDAAGRRRKYYAITAAGRDELATRIAEWTRFSGLVNHVLTTEVPRVS